MEHENEPFENEPVIDLLIEELTPISETYFFNTIAGTSHRNDDGTSRCRLIAQCDSGDSLQLVHDALNAYDGNAIEVLNEDDEQLGYLNRHTAEEVARNLSRKRKLYLCYLVRQNIHPETERVVGATIILFRIPPLFGGNEIDAQTIERARMLEVQAKRRFGAILNKAVEDARQQQAHQPKVMKPNVEAPNTTLTFRICRWFGSLFS